MHIIQAGWMKWRNTLRVICDCKIPNKLKEKFYQITIKSVMLYDNKYWALKCQQEQKMGVTKMRMLR